MKRKLLAALMLIMVFALAITGCGTSGDSGTESKTPDAEGGEKLRVAMVLPGLKTDEAFNQYTYEGMLRAKEELGIEIAYREEVAQDEQVEVIRQFPNSAITLYRSGGQFGGFKDCCPRIS